MHTMLMCASALARPRPTHASDKSVLRIVVAFTNTLLCGVTAHRMDSSTTPATAALDAGAKRTAEDDQGHARYGPCCSTSARQRKLFLAHAANATNPAPQSTPSSVSRQRAGASGTRCKMRIVLLYGSNGRTVSVYPRGHVLHTVAG